MVEEELVSGLDEYQKSLGKIRAKSNKAQIAIAKRICPHCRISSNYSNQRQYCKNCGQLFSDYVIRSKEQIERENDKKEKNDK